MNGKILGTAAGLLAAVLFLKVPAEAVSAEKALVLDPVGNHVVYEKRADQRSLIASTTKIMTALVAAENCNVLEQVKIPRAAVGIEGSSMYLEEGEVLTVQELLYGLMLRSGNDAAVAIAIHCGKTVEGFADMMNARAESLGLTGTHFENPHGLDGKHHYSTARDLAVLSAEAMKNPIFRKTVSTKQIRVGNRYLKNHNKLLWRVDGAEGIKTGYTKAAGRILVSSAMRNGRRLVAVTINDPDDWNDHEALLNLGFDRYRSRVLIRKGQQVGSLEVLEGEKSSVPLLAARDFSCYAAEGEKALAIFPGPGFVYAPVAEGGSPGEALVTISGTVVGNLPVIYGKTSEIKEETRFFNRIFGGTT